MTVRVIQGDCLEVSRLFTAYIDAIEQTGCTGHCSASDCQSNAAMNVLAECISRLSTRLELMREVIDAAEDVRFCERGVYPRLDAALEALDPPPEIQEIEAFVVANCCELCGHLKSQHRGSLGCLADGCECWKAFAEQLGER